MKLKKKRIIALTVKLLFVFVAAQAQNKQDSVKQKSIQFLPPYHSTLIKQQVLPQQLPANFYSKQLPFFCSQELHLQKATGIAIKFRLSTVEYCDKLEGKNR